MLTLYKIPVKSAPLVYLKERLKQIDTYRTVVIVPSNRNLHKLAKMANWQLDIQTVSVFTRRANLYNHVLLPPQLRSYYLYQAVRKLSKTDRQMILRTKESPDMSGYMNFLLKSSALLPFFRELCAEKISTASLIAASQYHDYAEQVRLLAGLWQIYCDVVAEAGFMDEWQCYENPALDYRYLERYDNYIFLIGGYLNHYEISQLKAIAQNHNTELFFNFTDAEHHQSSRFADEFGIRIQTEGGDNILTWYMEDEAGTGTKNGEHPIFLSHTYAEEKNGCLPCPEYGTYAEIVPCEGEMTQYELITRRILREHLENGIPLENMAVVLPSPDFAAWFLDSDIYGLYNVSAGRPVRSYGFFQALESIGALIGEMGQSDVLLSNLEKLAAHDWLFSEHHAPYFSALRKEGKLYVSMRELESVPVLHKFYNLVKPFLKSNSTYSGCMRELILLIRSMRTLCEKEDRPALDKTVDELDRMGMIYKNIREEMPTGELLNKILGELAILNHPAPAKGAAVLGLLESRNMQYDLLFIPHMNSGIFPPAQEKDLFLNSEIRQTLGLPTFADRQELQKNYYLQLMARSKKVLITYALSEERKASPFINEMLTQAKARLTDIPKYNPRHRITVPESGFCQTARTGKIVKRDEIRTFLQNMTYSATSLTCYQKCQLQFFYRYVKHLRPEEEAIDEIDMRVLGNVLDVTVFTLFQKGVTALDNSYLPLMIQCYGEEIRKYDYFTQDAVGIFHAEALKDRFPLLVQKDREHLLNSGLIKQYFKKRIDCALHGVRFSAELDRWDDTKNGRYIIDYKYKNLNTKKSAGRPEDFADTDVDLQMPLYALMMQESCGALPSQIYWFDLKGNKGLVEAFDMDTFESFQIYLEGLMGSILRDDAFAGSGNKDICTRCAYQTFCPESLV